MSTPTAAAGSLSTPDNDDARQRQGAHPMTVTPTSTPTPTPTPTSTMSVEESFETPSATPHVRQQLLVLYLGTSALDSEVIGWTRYDGTGQSRPTTGDSDEPPYATGLDALLDGWRLLQMSQLIAHPRGEEYDVGYLPYEYLFERLVGISAA
jgi:hypothetical protein